MMLIHLIYALPRRLRERIAPPPPLGMLRAPRRPRSRMRAAGSTMTSPLATAWAESPTSLASFTAREMRDCCTNCRARRHVAIGCNANSRYGTSITALDAVAERNTASKWHTEAFLCCVGDNGIRNDVWNKHETRPSRARVP